MKDLFIPLFAFQMVLLSRPLLMEMWFSIHPFDWTKFFIYIPTFACNLIFISKLTAFLNYTGHFFPTFCILRDPATRKLIGMNELKDGLYYFRTPHVPATSALATKNDSICCLWHQRLGHISLSLLKKTAKITTGIPNFNIIKEEDFHCLACY